jgi:hypothetical protein
MLSTRQKSNIRHFIFYLVNSTLNFELIQTTFGNNNHTNYYQTVLKSDPDFFYQTACVFINQETTLHPDWPYTEKLGRFICHLHDKRIDISDFEPWELNFTTDGSDFSSDFKQFTKWFIQANVVNGASFSNYIDDGASFAEQCFAIWTNVVTLDAGRVTNFEHAIKRVEEYIKFYYNPEYGFNLEEWECELW